MGCARGAVWQIGTEASQTLHSGSAASPTQELTGGANSGDPPAAKLNYTDECDAPIMAGSGGVLSAGKRAKHGSNVSLIAQLAPPAPSSRPPGRRYAHR